MYMYEFVCVVDRKNVGSFCWHTCTEKGRKAGRRRQPHTTISHREKKKSGEQREPQRSVSKDISLSFRWSLYPERFLLTLLGIWASCFSTFHYMFSTHSAFLSSLISFSRTTAGLHSCLWGRTSPVEDH